MRLGRTWPRSERVWGNGREEGDARVKSGNLEGGVALGAKRSVDGELANGKGARGEVG